MKKVKVKKHLLVSALTVFSIAVFAITVFFSTHWLESTTVTQEKKLDSILTRDKKTIFEPVLPSAHVSLPHDFRFHPDYQHEWWHYFARLQDEQGQTYNVQWSYFRVAIDERETSGWQSPQLYISYVVVSDESQVWQEQRLARGGIGQAGMINRPFRLWIDNWSWQSLSATPFPGHLNVTTDTFGLELNAMTSGPFVVNGDKGYQVKHELQSVASFSLSAPFLNVKGVLNLNNKRIPVTGSAWVQKEWGSGLIGEGQKGWDWFVFNLDDGRALTVTRYRHHGEVPYVFGTLSTRSGKVISLGEKDIHITPLSVTSLSNGRRLPLEWAIDVPKHQIDLTTHTSMSDMWLPFVLPHWEGPTFASGSHEAWGFMQLTGY